MRANDTHGQLAGLLDGFGIEGQAADDTFARIQRLYPDEGGPANDTSDLVDPTNAPDDWLAWIAQLYGISLADSAPVSFAGTYGALSSSYATYSALDAAFGSYGDQAAGTTPAGSGLTVAEQRALINARPGWMAGSTKAVRELVQQYLTGTKKVSFQRSYAGNWARVRVVSYTAQTPEAWKVAAILARPNIAPAGVELTHAVYDGASYGDLSAGWATYSLLDSGLGTYADTTAWIPT